MRLCYQNLICLFVGAFGYLPLCSASIQTEEHTPSQIFSLSLEQLLEVKVSGSTLRDEARSSVPSAVTVFTYEQIQRMGVTTLAELMNFAPGYQVQRSADTGAYTMASIRARRTVAPSTEFLIVIDGKRSQTLMNNGASFFLEMPLKHIARVEFMRGPGSAIYGSNAMMGVINIVTTRNKNEVDLLAGENNNTQLGLQWSKQHEDFNFHFLLDSKNSDGQDYALYDAFRDFEYPVSDPSSTHFAKLKLGYKTLTFGLQHFSFNTEDFYVLESVYPNHNRNDIAHNIAFLSWSFSIKDLDSKIKISKTEYLHDVDGKSAPEGSFSLISSPGSDAPLLFQSDTQANERYIGWESDWSISSHNQLLFGAEWRSEAIDEVNTYLNFDLFDINNGVVPVRYYPDFTAQAAYPTHFDRQTITSVYTQWQATFFKKSHLTMGFRNDVYKEIDESQLTPRFAWVQNLNENHSFKLLYAHAFRAPSLSNLNADSTWSRADPTLQAETVKTSELIWTGKHRNVFWNIGHFYSRFSSPILLEVPEEGDSTTRILTNSDHNDIAGLEFEMTYKPDDNWLLRTTATNIYRTDDIMFRESRDMFSLEVNYSHHQNWNINLTTAWRSERFTYDPAEDNARRQLPDYWLTYGKLTYRVRKGVNIYAQASNLLDEEQYYPSAGSRLPQGIPSRGREMALGLDWHFDY